MADEKISDLPAASSVADADIAPIVQGGTNKKSAMSVIKTYLTTAFNSIYVIVGRTLTIGGSAKTLAADRSWTTTEILEGIGSPAWGDIIYRGVSNWVVLTAGTNGNQLTTHGAGANPTWESGTAITPSALTKTDDTNVTLTLGGTPTTALLQATSLTLGWTGTLAAARGGTGVGSLGNITKTDDTNVTLTLGGTPTGAVITSTSFTLGWTGQLSGARGGTGVDNTGKTITLANNLVTSGNFSLTLTQTGTTNVTLPTTGTLATLAGTETLTNKRVTRRVTSTNAPGATPTINTDNCDAVHLTGLATAITSMTTNLSGTPVQGDTLRIDFTDDGTARAITWGASFEASTVALPTTTVISTRLDVGFIWNTVTSKWRCVAVA